MVEVKVGTKVLVFSKDEHEYLGRGKVVDHEPYMEEEGFASTKPLLFYVGQIDVTPDKVPLIELKKGEIISTQECWWYPVKMKKELGV